MNFISRLDVNFLDNAKFGQSQWSVKSRSRAPGQGAFLKSVSRTITMQGFILKANTAAMKLTLFLDDVNFLDWTQNFDKVSGV